MEDFINSRGISGRTALHRACQCKSAACVSILLEHGAEVNARDDKGRTPLYWASLAPFNDDVIAILLQSKYLDPHILADDGSSILHAAASTNNEALYKKFTDLGVRPDITNDSGKKASELLVDTSSTNNTTQNRYSATSSSVNSSRRGTLHVLGSLLSRSSKSSNGGDETPASTQDSSQKGGTIKNFMRRASISPFASAFAATPANEDSGEKSPIDDDSEQLNLYEFRNKFYKKNIPHEEDTTTKFKLVSSICALDSIECVRI